MSATTFLHLLYGDQAGFAEVFSGIRPEPGAKDFPEKTLHSRWYDLAHDTDAMADRIAQEAAEPKREVYVTVRAFSPPPKGQRKPKRSKHDPKPVRVLFADGDGATVPPEAPQPTIIIESSPGRHQYLWVLDQPVTTIQAENLSKRLAYLLGADPSGTDMAQLVRVPGTRNWKYDGAPLVRLVSTDGPTHTAVDLDAALPGLPEQPRPAPSITPEDAGGVLPPVRHLSTYVLELWRGDHPVRKPDGTIDRSKSLWPIAKELARADLAQHVIAACLAERDRSLGYHKATSRDDGATWYADMAADAIAAVEAEQTSAAPEAPAERCDHWKDRALRAEAENAELKERVRLLRAIHRRSDLKDMGAELAELAFDIGSVPLERRAEQGGIRVTLDDAEVIDHQTGEVKTLAGFGSRVNRDPDAVGRHLTIAAKVIPRLSKKRKFIPNAAGQSRSAIIINWEADGINDMLADILTIPVDLPKREQKTPKIKPVEAEAPAPTCPDCGSDNLVAQEPEIIVRDTATCGDCNTVVTIRETPVPAVTPLVNLPGAGVKDEYVHSPPDGVVNLPGAGLVRAPILTAVDLTRPDRLQVLRGARPAPTRLTLRCLNYEGTDQGCQRPAAADHGYCVECAALGWGQEDVEVFA